MTNSFYSKQIQNRNYLSPTGFKFTLAKTPKVDFFSNSAKLPGIQLGSIGVGNYLKEVPIPGDTIAFEDLTLQFLVDENMENYMEIHNWIYGLGYPKSLQQFRDLVDDRGSVENGQQFSDGTLAILNSNYNPMIYVKFRLTNLIFTTNLQRFRLYTLSISTFTIRLNF
jgi:hypothetical protein